MESPEPPMIGLLIFILDRLGWGHPEGAAFDLFCEKRRASNLEIIVHTVATIGILYFAVAAYIYIMTDASPIDQQPA